MTQQKSMPQGRLKRLWNNAGFQAFGTEPYAVAVGEGYTTKANALNGIESIKKNAPDAPIKDLIVKEEKPETPIEDPIVEEEKPEAPANIVRDSGKSGVDWLVIGLATLFVTWLIYLIIVIVIT